MKKIIASFAALCLCVLALAGCNTGDAELAGELRPLGEEFVQMLMDQDFQGCFDRCDAQMQAAVPLEYWGESIYPGVIDLAGVLTEFTEATATTSEGYDVLLLQAKHEKKDVVYTISFDADRKVGGLFYR